MSLPATMRKLQKLNETKDIVKQKTV